MSRRRGNLNENIFMAQAEALGYCAFASRGSRGCIDVVCFFADTDDADWDELLPPLAVQVGTGGKPVARTLAELEAAPRPIGSLCLVARRMPLKATKNGRQRPWKYSTRYGHFDTLEEALRARNGS